MSGGAAFPLLLMALLCCLRASCRRLACRWRCHAAAAPQARGLRPKGDRLPSRLLSKGLRYDGQPTLRLEAARGSWPICAEGLCIGDLCWLSSLGGFELVRSASHALQRLRTGRTQTQKTQPVAATTRMSWSPDVEQRGNCACRALCISTIEIRAVASVRQRLFCCCCSDLRHARHQEGNGEAVSRAEA